MKSIKKIILILNILLTQILLSQTVFDISINKNHSYDVYGNDSLNLILDKTDSTFIFLSLPTLKNGGDLKHYAISEGKYHINKRCLTLTSIDKKKYSSSSFDDLTGLRFNIKKGKLIPKSDKYKYYPYGEELDKTDLREIDYPIKYID